MAGRFSPLAVALGGILFLLGVSRPLEPGPPGLSRAIVQAAIERLVNLRQLEDVHFEFDSWQIGLAELRVIEANVRQLKQLGARQILLEGHTDEWGSQEYDLRLGERRVQAVRAAFIERGLDASAITTVSYGKARPRCLEHHRVCWAENRRVHVQVSVSEPGHQQQFGDAFQGRDSFRQDLQQDTTAG